jgi:hypothetical protein
MGFYYTVKYSLNSSKLVGANLNISSILFKADFLSLKKATFS